MLQNLINIRFNFILLKPEQINSTRNSIICLVGTNINYIVLWVTEKVHLFIWSFYTVYLWGGNFQPAHFYAKKKS